MVTRILCPSHVPREHTLPTQSRVLSPANCLLQETQEKARAQGLYLLTKREHHSKSKPKPQGHCSFSFPWANGKWCQFQEYQATKGKGCQLSSANRKLERELGLIQLKGKSKSPSLFLVLLSSQTLQGAASFVLEGQSNICRWVSLALVTILHQRIKPTFQYGKNRSVMSCQVLKLKKKKRLPSQLRLTLGLLAKGN